jgi:flagellar protein FliS
MVYLKPTAAYLNTRASSSVHEASPHKLIALLLDACHDNLATAKGAMERREIKKKAEAIKKAMDIIVRLQASLDFDGGGKIAINLDELYTFCTNRLAMANALNDTALIDEVFRVIAEIKAGWLEIEGAAST